MIFKQWLLLAAVWGFSIHVHAQNETSPPADDNSIDTDVAEQNSDADIRSDDKPPPHNWGKIKKGLVITVNSPYVDIHTFAGRTYPVFHVVEKGEQVIIFKQRNDWYKIKTTDGKIGWVHRKHLVGTSDEQGRLLSLRKPDWRDYIENNCRINIMAGRFENIVSYSPSFGINFTNNIAVELRLSQAFGDISTFKMAGLNLLHKPMPHWRAQPFFTLGGGGIKTMPSTITADTKDRQDTYYTVGGGVDFQFNEQLSVRFEYNNHTILTNRSENEEVEEWKAGFSVLF